jgi:outer membrane lipoprotein-sorting protein
VRIWAIKPILCAVALSVTAMAQTDVQAVVARMVAAQQQAKENLRAYQATRRYQIFKGEEQKSQVTAEVNYEPPQRKSFNIVQSTGGTGEGVVKKALEHEVAATRDPRDYEISPANYDFEYAGEADCSGSRCFILTLKPKRDCKDLIEGKAWVDQNTYLIRRVEGELAKSPSWWVKKAAVVIEYGAVEGMWIQTKSVADAKLRIVGDYKLVSQNVELRAAATEASARRPQSSFRRRLANSALVGEAGFFLPTRK